MELFRQIAAVTGVLTLLLVALWWLRRRGFVVSSLAGRPIRRMECVERLSLGPHQALHLIRLGNSALVVASSPAGCSLIASLALSATSVPEQDQARSERSGAAR